MIIRCERCSTMYELDEALLAPTGSPVQCTKCQHVFTAFPPRAAARTLSSMPEGRPTDQAPGMERPEPRPAPDRAPPSPAGSARAEPPVARSIRSGPPPVYRPPVSSAPPVGRSRVLKRDTVGAFEARLRWSARWRWLAPTIAVAVLAVVAAIWLIVSWRGRAAGSRGHAEALALVALDDAASLDEAATKLAAAAGRAGKHDTAAADRALTLALRAAGLAEEREAFTARLASRSEERDRSRRDAPAAPATEEQRPDETDVALERDVRAREDRVRTLTSAAGEAIRAAAATLGEVPEVVRAEAVLHAAMGEREQLQKLLGARRDRGRDPWLDLADGWMDARDPDRAVRERALVKLGALAAARPDILRGRYLMARTEASLGHRGQALATVDGVLSANRRHEGARRLREDLAAHVVPPPHAPAPSQPAAPPAPEPAAAPKETEARKIVPHPGTAVSPPAAQSAPTGSPVAGAGPESPPPPVVEAEPPAPPAVPVVPPSPPAPVAAPEIPPAAPPPPPPRAQRRLEDNGGSHGG